jgi:hypothetical protein
MTIFAHNGRPPLWSSCELSAWLFNAVCEADGLAEVAVAPDEAGVEEALCGAVVEGPNSPLKYACTSVGSAVNQSGVWSSRNSDHSNFETAGTLVRARARIDGGTPVTRTCANDALAHLLAHCSKSKAQGALTGSFHRPAALSAQVLGWRVPG